MRKIIYSILSLLFVANTMMADDLVTGAFVGPSKDNYWTLDINLTNETSFVACMMDVNLPAGFTVKNATPVASRLSQNAEATIDGKQEATPFVVTYNIVKDNTVRVTAYNNANNAIVGESGTPILKLLLQADGEKSYADMVASFSNVNFVKAESLAESTVNNTSADASHMDEYLKITALKNSSTYFHQTGTVSATLQYGTATDGWKDYTYDTPISIEEGNSVWFRAKGTDGKNSALNSMNNYIQFVENGNGSIAASQNVMSLLDASCSQKTVPSSAFFYLFKGCTSLTHAPELPATKLSSYCYYSMFEDCTSLTTIPNLSHASCSEGSTIECKNMFKGCTGLRMNTMGLGTPWKAPSHSDTTPVNHLCNMLQDTGGNMNSIGNGTSIGTPNMDDTYYVLDQPYTRSMPNQWGTICLPYAVTITGDEDYDFYNLSSVSNSTLILQKIFPTGDETYTTIAAGTPVIIRRSTSVNEISIPASTQDMTFVTTPVTGASANGLTLTGAFSQMDITSKDGYVIANNSFWNIAAIKGENKVYCDPFHAYLAGTVSNTAKMLTIGFGDDTPTAVESINAITNGKAEYYDLNGRRLNALQQGINIVKFNNGTTKKIIIK